MFRRQKRKNLDFRKVEKQMERRDALGRHGKHAGLLLPLVLSVLYLQNYLYYIDKNHELEDRILELQSVLKDEEILEEKERLETMEQNLELLKQYEAKDHGLRLLSEERSLFGSEVLMAVEAAMEGRVTMVWDEKNPFHYEEGILTFTARTAEPAEASRYIERLKTLEIIASVEYGGFEKEAAADGETQLRYRFDVTCTLSGPDGKERKKQREEAV